MDEIRKKSLKKPLTFSVFLIFLFVLMCGKGYTAQKPDDIDYSLTEKTISSILSILGGNHLTIVLKTPDNGQDDKTSDDDKKKDTKKSESDPYDNNGSRTSKKKANSED